MTTLNLSKDDLPRLDGKTAIITGGTTGIGRAIALEYLRQGCNVVVNHLDLPRDRGHLDTLTTEATAIKNADPNAGALDHLAGDVTDPATGPALVDHAVRRFGTGDSAKLLTKGDNNAADDTELYARGQDYLERRDIIGSVVAYIPFVGYVTILLSEHPWLKTVMLGIMGLLVVLQRE